MLNIFITLSGLPGEVPWQRRSLVSGPENSLCRGKWRLNRGSGPEWRRQAQPCLPAGLLGLTRPGRTWPGQRGRALARPNPPRPGRPRACSPLGQRRWGRGRGGPCRPGRVRRGRGGPCRPGRVRRGRGGPCRPGRVRRGRGGPCRPGRVCRGWYRQELASGGPAVHGPAVAPEHARGNRRSPCLARPGWRRQGRGAAGRCCPGRNRVARRGRKSRRPALTWRNWRR
jgi:hypothetical protein